MAQLVNGFDKTEKIVGIISVADFDGDKDQYVQFYTEGGMIKRTHLREYESKVSKIQACRLKDDDLVIAVELTEGNSDILIVTQNGMSICFSGSEVNSTGRVTMGVKAVQLKKKDRVIFAQEVNDEGELIVVTNRGFAKRTLIADYERQGRGGVGVKTVTFSRNGSAAVPWLRLFVRIHAEVILMQQDGTTTRLDLDSLPIEKQKQQGQPVAMVLMDNEVITAYRNYN